MAREPVDQSGNKLSLPPQHFLPNREKNKTSSGFPFFLNKSSPFNTFQRPLSGGCIERSCRASRSIGWTDEHHCHRFRPLIKFCNRHRRSHTDVHYDEKVNTRKEHLGETRCGFLFAGGGASNAIHFFSEQHRSVSECVQFIRLTVSDRITYRQWKAKEKRSVLTWGNSLTRTTNISLSLSVCSDENRSEWFNFYFFWFSSHLLLLSSPAGHRSIQKILNVFRQSIHTLDSPPFFLIDKTLCRDYIDDKENLTQPLLTSIHQGFPYASTSGRRWKSPQKKKRKWDDNIRSCTRMNNLLRAWVCVLFFFFQFGKVGEAPLFCFNTVSISMEAV